MHANIHGKNDQSGIPLQRLSYDRLEANGVYLIGMYGGARKTLGMRSYSCFDFEEGPDATFVWIGRSISVELLQGLFGKCDLSQVDTQLVSCVCCHFPVNVFVDKSISETLSQTQIPYLDNPFSQKFTRLMEEKTTKALRIVRQGLDDERDCMNVLVEDATFNQLSYVDYLCMVHKQIQNEVGRL